jgi:formylglycine-generating enzyme required for sulfatase activity
MLMLSYVIAVVALAAAAMVEIPAGNYRPLYLSDDSPIVKVVAFRMDRLPVTNQQFFEFVTHEPQWQKKNIPRLFTEPQYLQHWQYHNDLKRWQPDISQSNSAVVHVSWFAAQAYCQAQGKRLPTVAEWEYVARASESQADGSQEASYQQRILSWYARPTSESSTAVGQTAANYWGVQDLHGLHWEWTEDFNASLISGESRADSSVDQKLYCAAGAAGAADPSDYAAFMRYGLRSSLQAKFSLANLGFRCAADREEN